MIQNIGDDENDNDECYDCCVNPNLIRVIRVIRVISGN